MMRVSFTASLLSILHILSVVANRGLTSKIPTIEVHGNKFFNSKTGEQFFIKGIAYQPGTDNIESISFEENFGTKKYIDPLAQSEICLRDLPYLEKLNINTVRVYAIDPEENHDECMNAFAKSGIYVLLDLSEPDLSIARDSPSWDVDVFQRYMDVVDAMYNYDNVLGFFAGNEVTNDKTNTDASTFVLASIRDIKKYIEEKGYRKIPVGYSTNDDSETRDALASYFVCSENMADFYGINMYEWCGYSSYSNSGYRERTQEFKDFPVPVFFSEFGCNLKRPRPFTEVGALFGPLMTPVWSGGLAYMYFEEENEYGVVKLSDDGDILELDDFHYLQKEYEKAKPKGTNLKAYREAHSQPKRECPKMNAFWKASSILPPRPNQEKCTCLDDALPCISVANKDSSTYEELFDYICGQVDCSDIEANGTTGQYGEYSDCNVRQKFDLQLSKLYYMDDEQRNICPISRKDIYFNVKSLNPQAKCKALKEKVKLATKFKKPIVEEDKEIENVARKERLAAYVLFLTLMFYSLVV